MTLSNTQQWLLDIITTCNLDKKIELGLGCTKLTCNQITPIANQTLLNKPGRPTDINIINPRNVPKRSFKNPESRINFLHAIAHIELLAIELPALCLLRFGSSDIDFIKNQFRIISEEAKHFKLLRNRLRDYGCEFGSRPLHLGLWDQAMKCSSELEHQIIIPCHLEARGLDVSPEFIKKFIDAGDEKSADIMKLILKEEIGHVKFGIDYLGKKAISLGTTSDNLFKDILTGFFGDNLKSKVPINSHYRKQAGFSDQQLRYIN